MLNENPILQLKAKISIHVESNKDDLKQLV